MFPEFLLQRLKSEYSSNEVEKILNGYGEKRNTTLRVNTLKSNIDEVKEALQNSRIEYEETSFSENALILNNADEKQVQNLHIYDEGKIYLQSLSSMLPPIILEPKLGENILDMTAAPGGKTTQIAALTNNKAQITACEMNRIRSEKLKYNIEKQGVKCVNVMVTDSRNLSDYFVFDKILLDAPCSGSGTINLETDFSNTFTPNLIEKSIKAQEALLKKAIRILKPGGEIVYSTCSILKEENEDIVLKAIKTAKVQIVPINSELIKQMPTLTTKLEGTLCVCPNENYEGFFVCKLKKA